MTTINSCVVDRQIKIDFYGVKGAYSFVLNDSTIFVESKTGMYAIFAQYVMESGMQSCTFKVCEGSNSRYIYLNPNKGMLENNHHKEIRKAIADESDGAWVEIKNGVNRFFVANPTLVSAGIKEDRDAFFKKTRLTPEAFLAQPVGDRERADTEFDELDGDSGNYMPMPASSSDDEDDAMLPTFMNPKVAKKERPTKYVPMPTEDAVGGGFIPKQPKSPSGARSNYVPMKLAPIVDSSAAESLIPVFLREVDFQTLLQGGSLNLQLTTSEEDGSEGSKHVLGKVESGEQLPRFIPKKVAISNPDMAQPGKSLYVPKTPTHPESNGYMPMPKSVVGLTGGSTYMPMPQKKVPVQMAKAPKQIPSSKGAGSTYMPFPNRKDVPPARTPKFHNDGNHYIPLEGESSQDSNTGASTYINLTEYAQGVRQNAQAPKGTGGTGAYVNMAEINSKVPPKITPKIATGTYMPFPKKSESSEDEDF